MQIAEKVIEIIKDSEKQTPKLRAIVQHKREEVLQVNYSSNINIRIHFPLLIELDNIRSYLKRLKYATRSYMCFLFRLNFLFQTVTNHLKRPQGEVSRESGVI